MSVWTPCLCVGWGWGVPGLGTVPVGGVRVPGGMCDPEPAVCTHVDVMGGPGESWGRRAARLALPGPPPGPPSRPPARPRAPQRSHFCPRSAERMRGPRCPGNAAMPSNKSAARVTWPARTNRRARPEAGQPGPKSASRASRPGERLPANYRNCGARAPGRAGPGAGGLGRPRGAERGGAARQDSLSPAASPLPPLPPSKRCLSAYCIHL